MMLYPVSSFARSQPASVLCPSLVVFVLFVGGGDLAELICWFARKAEGVTRQCSNAVDPAVVVVHGLAASSLVDIPYVVARCCEWVRQSMLQLLTYARRCLMHLPA